MKKLMFVASLSFAVSGCFGPGDPVELPESAVKAAETCFAAQALTFKIGAEADDLPSYSEFSDIIQYPMMAAAQTEPFTVETVMKVLNGAEATAETIRSKDYEGAVPACEARFGLSKDGPKLPEKDNDAFLSCLSMSAFMTGVAQESGIKPEKEGASITGMVERLEERMKSDPDLLAMMVTGDSEKLMTDSLKLAFAEGDPAGYIEKCDARFPAK